MLTERELKKHKSCCIKGCLGLFYSKGYCRKHWLRKRKHPELRATYLEERHCMVEGCKKKFYSRGCCFLHYQRFFYNNPMDLRFKLTLKGDRNPRWNGGTSVYPNHYLMKKNRLIILMNNPKCEICGRPATEIHHRDGDKSNHKLNNLMASCRSCNCKIRFGPNNSKFYRLYGMNLKKIGKKLGYSESYCSILYKLNKLELLLKD